MVSFYSQQTHSKSSVGDLLLCAYFSNYMLTNVQKEQLNKLNLFWQFERQHYRRRKGKI